MRILITGNMGYIGPSVVRTLRSAYPSAELIGYDAGYMAHCLTGAHFLPERLLDRQIFGDVRDLPEDALRGVDAVIHLAAVSNDPMGKAYEAVTEEVNYRASVRLAQLAKTAGVRAFVFASSCSVYGYAEGGARSERAELNPLTAYARSKINTEKDIEPLAGRDFVITSLRFPTACGMSERLRLDLVLNDFVASAVASGRIQILSDGTPWRPLININDMARSMAWALERPADAGGAFLAVNVGRNEWNFQIRELADAVAKQIPGVEVDVNTEAAPDKRSYQVDFSLYAELAPDHLPQYSVEDSVAGLHEGLRQMGFADAAFRESQLIRLRVLGGLRDSGHLDDDLRWSRPPATAMVHKLVRTA